jgi:hypothetical protein
VCRRFKSVLRYQKFNFLLHINDLIGPMLADNAPLKAALIRGTFA